MVASHVRPYGWFIDELYYVACARRLAFGYVDHPPFSVAVLALVRGAFGDSLLAPRVVAAFTTGASVVLAGALARERGDARLARCIAAVAVASTGGVLAVGSSSR